ncbi:MAG: hypothetical protein AAB875_06390 [Patescibacteria group bacterium]
MNNLAQGTGVSIEEKFFGKSGGFLTNITDVGKLVSIIVSNAIIIAGIILLFLMVFGGISMIAGAGSQNPEQVAKGRQAVTSALIGFIIVFAAYWIVQLIGAITGINILGT